MEISKPSNMHLFTFENLKKLKPFIHYKILQLANFELLFMNICKKNF